MKLKNVLYGLRTTLDDPLFVLSTAAITVPLAIHEKMEPFYAYGFLGLGLWEVYKNVLAYNDIDERINKGNWDAGLVQNMHYTMNLQRYVACHPEHKARYERLERELFPHRSRE